MGALRDLIKAIDLLADSLFGLTTELALIRKDKAEEKKPFKIADTPTKVYISGPISSEFTATLQAGRNRWTPEEEQIILAGYANGLKPKAIRVALEARGVKRGEHAIVDHMHELRKKAKK